MYCGLAIDRRQTDLIFDFGAGTLDVTVARFGDQRNIRQLGQKHILGKANLPIAGNAIDEAILRRVVVPQYGEEALLSVLGLYDLQDLARTRGGWQLLRQIEQAKIELSGAPQRDQTRSDWTRGADPS
ncbi:MAG: hypothetical protein AB1331_08510 [Bacillota bacterium]